MKNVLINSVLVADDDPLLVLLLVQALKELDIREISTAFDGKKAVELYKKYLPDLVILDMEMPVKNGYRAAKDIKSINPDAKIVILTGNPAHEDIQKALEEGVITSLFIKPISIDIINKILLKGDSKKEQCRDITTKLDLTNSRLSRDLISAA